MFKICWSVAELLRTCRRTDMTKVLSDRQHKSS